VTASHVAVTSHDNDNHRVDICDRHCHGLCLWLSNPFGLACVFHESDYQLHDTTMKFLMYMFAHFSLWQQFLFVMCDVDTYVTGRDINNF